MIAGTGRFQEPHGAVEDMLLAVPGRRDADDVEMRGRAGRAGDAAADQRADDGDGGASASTRLGRRAVAVTQSTISPSTPGILVAYSIERIRIGRRSAPASGCAVSTRSSIVAPSDHPSLSARKAKGLIEIAIERDHDQIERRVAFVGAEVADAFRVYFQVQRPLVVGFAGRGWPPRRRRLVAAARGAQPVQRQCRHPGREVGHGRVVELPVRRVLAGNRLGGSASSV